MLGDKLEMTGSAERRHGLILGDVLFYGAIRLQRSAVAVPLSMTGQKMGATKKKKKKRESDCLEKDECWASERSLSHSWRASRGTSEAGDVFGKLPAAADHIDVTRCVFVAHH